jgi:AcrR family transcriptional regulator
MSETQDTSRAAESTREQLLDAAEKLFLEHGLDEVSLRAIVREAGQRNQSALQYHFGGREELIIAILNRRMQQVEARRRSLMDAALAGGAALDLRDGCALLVRAPFLLCREHRDFRAFLGQFGQRLLASGRDITLAVDHQQLPSLRDMRRLLRHKLRHVHPELLALRIDNANGLGLLAISRRARLGGSFRGRRAELFFNNLVDQVAAMLAAPVSAATEALLDDTE